MLTVGIRGFVPQGYRELETAQLTAPQPKASRENDDDDEEDDPLDAFMLDIDNQVKKESMEDPPKEKVS